MALKNKFVILLLMPFVIRAESLLPELLTKQTANNIRFISSDGKFTYYQKKTGELLMSTNYKVTPFLKQDTDTQFTMTSSPARKKILIWANNHYHSFYSLRSKNKIFQIDFGETTPTEIGEGLTPKLHLNDQWVSFYNPENKTISFVSTKSTSVSFSIVINVKVNPYFIPQVVMTDEDTVYYTDLGEKAVPGIVEYKRGKKEANVVYKSNSPMLKIELCSNNNKLYIGQFGLNTSTTGSSIYSIDLPIQQFSLKEPLYKSALNDLGQIQCQYSKDQLLFIKNYDDDKKSLDVAEFTLDKKTLKKLSEHETITNLIDMDGTILTFDRSKIFIVKGSTDFKSIDSFKGSEEKNKK